MAMTAPLTVVSGFPYRGRLALLDRWRAGGLPVILGAMRGAPGAILAPPAHVEPLALEAAGVAIGTIVTVVQTDCFFSDLSTTELLRHRGWAAGAGDGRAVADLLAEQVESSDAVVLSGPDPQGDVGRCVRLLNPTATILSDRPDLALDDVTSVTRPRAVGSAARWAAALAAGRSSRDVLYFRGRRPFHPGRFATWMRRHDSPVLRAKGHCWLANRPEQIVGFSTVVNVQRLFPLGRWQSGQPLTVGTAPVGAWDRLLADWDRRFGDRYNELALVGPALDHHAEAAALHACCLTDAELAPGPADWTVRLDPFDEALPPSSWIDAPDLALTPSAAYH